jgi:hypothetical protein
MSFALSMPAKDDGWVGNWSPGIGDPTLVGWLTVVVYFATAWRCWKAARRISGSMAALREARRERLFWTILSVLFSSLGINKQLDLQSLLTELGRLLARDQGWYDARRSVQFVFILIVGALGLAAAGAGVLLVRKGTLGARIAAAGAALATAFVLIRAASFHHVDRFIGSRWLGLRANWLLELGALAIVIAGTIGQERVFRRQ